MAKEIKKWPICKSSDRILFQNSFNRIISRQHTSSTNHSLMKHDAAEQNNGNRTDEESLLSSDEEEEDDDDDERREERTTDDDLLRTTDDDDGNTITPMVNPFTLSPTKRKVRKKTYLTKK